MAAPTDKVKVYIVREADGTYSSYIDEKSNLPYGLVGEGNTVAEAIDEWTRCYKDMQEFFKEEGRDFPEVTFVFTYDVPSFLRYYGGKLTFSGLSRITGVSAAQLSQYAGGYRTPSPKTTQKIQQALHAFAQDLSQVQLV